MLRELPNVEARLAASSSSLCRSYTTTLALYCVGVLRKYHKVFILNPGDVVTAFDQLSRIAYRPQLPSDPGRLVVSSITNVPLFDCHIACNSEHVCA